MEMKIGETFYAVTRKDFRMWLARHHEQKEEIWLIFHYKSTGKPNISYNDAVEEAICYGWIDSQAGPMDKERFVRRFSPRRKQSGWSKYNKERALRMLCEGKMTPAGLALLPMDVLMVGHRQE
jgi:uncharacterized protein YdeI (YjbR/CyaY-like superfamily)